MNDEWTKVISGDRIVTFTYVDLPGRNAFPTAQIAGHKVVYSVLWVKRNTHSIAKALNVRCRTVDIRNGVTEGSHIHGEFTR